MKDIESTIAKAEAMLQAEESVKGRVIPGGYENPWANVSSAPSAPKFKPSKNAMPVAENHNFNQYSPVPTGFKVRRKRRRVAFSENLISFR